MTMYKEDVEPSPRRTTIMHVSEKDQSIGPGNYDI